MLMVFGGPNRLRGLSLDVPRLAAPSECARHLRPRKTGLLLVN